MHGISQSQAFDQSVDSVELENQYDYFEEIEWKEGVATLLYIFIKKYL